jgi:hypothetical protein
VNATQIILEGDAAELVPFEQIAECDVMLTDPEYSRHTHQSAISCCVDSPHGTRPRDFGFAHMTPRSRRWLARAAASVKRWSVMYSDVEGSTWLRIACQAAGLEYIRTVPWVRWSMPQLTGDRPPQGFEHVCVFHRQHHGPRGGVKSVAKHWNGPGNLTALNHKCLRGEDKHSAEKPLDQALDLVAWFSDPGECVFDPRAGSGTIGLACALLGRSYVGVEQDREWADRASMRLEAPLSDRDQTRLERWAASVVAGPACDRLQAADIDFAASVDLGCKS